MKNGHGKLEHWFSRAGIQIKFNMFCNFHEMCYQCYERNNFKPFLTKQLLSVFKI